MRFGIAFRRCVVVFVLCGMMAMSPGCSPFPQLNSGDALGLEDWERDLLLAGLGIGATLLFPGGENFFSIFVDEFGGRDTAAFPYGEGGSLPFVDPVLGRAPVDPDNNVSFRVSVPSEYNGSRPICVRMFLLRTGGAVAGNLVFTVTVRSFQDGQSGEAIYIGATTVSVNPATSVDEFKDLVLPLNAGIPNGLGGGNISAGDLLAFELESIASDGGEYQLLGVEFYDSNSTAAVNGATIS